MIRVVAIVVLATLVSPVALAMAQPLPKISPSMGVVVYPDGSIRVLYNLTATSPLGKEVSGSGNISVEYVSKGSENRVVTELTGGGELNISGGAGKASNASMAVKALVKFESSREGGYSRAGGTFTLDFEGVAGNKTTYLHFTVKEFLVTITKDGAEVEFNVLISAKNLTIPETLVGVDVAPVINSNLSSLGVKYLRVKSLTIAREGEGYSVKGSAELFINDLINQLLEEGLILPTDVDRAKSCISEGFMELAGFYELDIAFNAASTASSESLIKFSISSKLDMSGDLPGYEEYSSKCGSVLGKLVMGLVLTPLTKLRVGGQPSPFMPMSMALQQTPIEKPKLVHVYPYESTAKVLVSLNGTHAVVSVIADSGRLVHPEARGSPEDVAKASLLELSNYLVKLSRQFSFMEFAGMGNPIPKEVLIKGASLGGARVEVGVKETSVSRLGEVGVKVVGATKPTQTTSSPATGTPTATTSTVTVTKEVTKIITVVKTSPAPTTVTATMTTTATQKVTVTKELTRTVTSEVVREVPAVPTWAVIAAAVIVAAAIVAAVAIARRR